MSTTKTYLSANQLLNDSFQLGTQIINSGFKPTFIVGIWRGGPPVGIAVQEILAYAGIQTDNIAIRTSSYKQGIDQQKGHVEVYGLSYLVKRLSHEDKLLIVDDVFDTGRTIDAVIDRLHKLLLLLYVLYKLKKSMAFLVPYLNSIGNMVNLMMKMRIRIMMAKKNPLKKTMIPMPFLKTCSSLLSMKISLQKLLTI